VAIQASDVKKLREKTGAGMMECKKALQEADGDFPKAEKILKELGLAAAAKRSDRATNEGRIFTKIEGGKAGILEIACETDFVARNEDFQGLGSSLLTDIFDTGVTKATEAMENEVKETISKLKENLSLRRFETLTVNENEAVVDYIHGEGRIGVLVKVSADKAELKDNEDFKQFLFDCALHVAAFNPQYLAPEDVDAGYMKEQEEIFTTQAENLGKPEKIIQGIVKGKLNKHLSEICFLKQGFVKEEKKSVEKVTEELSKKIGGTVKIEEYKYYSVGEEI
jgi:elongation factor Ts